MKLLYAWYVVEEADEENVLTFRAGPFCTAEEAEEAAHHSIFLKPKVMYLCFPVG